MTPNSLIYILPIELLLDIISAIEGDTVDKLLNIGHINRRLRFLLLHSPVLWKCIDLRRHKENIADTLIHVSKILSSKSLEVCYSKICYVNASRKNYHRISLIDGNHIIKGRPCYHTRWYKSQGLQYRNVPTKIPEFEISEYSRMPSAGAGGFA
jgi:hypothetical protein